MDLTLEGSYTFEKEPEKMQDVFHKPYRKFSQLQWFSSMVLYVGGQELSPSKLFPLEAQLQLRLLSLPITSFII